MRFFKGLIYFFVIVTSFLFGILSYAPWADMMQWSLARVRKEASAYGASLTYGDIQVSGLFPVFHISDLDVETPFARVSVSGVRLEPHFLRSLLSFSPSCSMSHRNANIKAVYGKELSLTSGAFNINASSSSVRVDDISIVGDLELHGSVHFDFNSRKIIDSTIAFKVSADLETLLKNPMLSKFVTQDTDGEWRLRYGE